MKKIKMNGQERAKTRDEMLQTYGGYGIKADVHDMNQFMNVESLSSNFYAGIAPQRHQEMADGGMIKEDRNAVANLSSEFIHREYPGAYFGSNIFIDDTVKE